MERQYAAYTKMVAGMHNALRISEPLPVHVAPFHHRPYRVIHADRFCQALLERITDEGVLRLPKHMGSTSQWVDSTDVQTYPRWFAPLRALYGA